MALPEVENVTYADYLGWDEDVRCEVLDGRNLPFIHRWDMIYIRRIN